MDKPEVGITLVLSLHFERLDVFFCYREGVVTGKGGQDVGVSMGKKRWIPIGIWAEISLPLLI